MTKEDQGDIGFVVIAAIFMLVAGIIGLFGWAGVLSIGLLLVVLATLMIWSAK